MDILILAANPLATSRLALDEEIRAIEREIVSSKLRDRVKIRSALAVTPSDFVKSLNEFSPDILHFSGHGAEDGNLILSDGNGGRVLADPDVIADLFSTLPKVPRLVVMNACFSIKNASAMTRFSDVVLGMPESVSDTDAITFSAFLYSALCSGLNVHDAFRQSIIGVKLSNSAYWQNGEPVMLVKENVSAKDVFLFSGEGLSFVESRRRNRLTFKDRDNGRGFLKRDFVDFCENLEKFGIVFIDINGMNKINTNFGKSVGDVVIAETFMLIDSQNPEAVAVGLCGDDTYFVIYQGVDRGGIISAGTRTMLAIEKNDWGRIHEKLFVHVAGGFAVRKDGEHPADVADRAGIGLKTAQTTKVQSYGAEDSVKRRFRGKPLDERYKIEESEILSWFS